MEHSVPEMEAGPDAQVRSGLLRVKGSRDVDMLAVQVGVADGRAATVLAVLREHGTVQAATAGADRSEVDTLLSTVDGRRLVVLGDLPGLNRIVLRLLRRDLLASTEIAAVVDSPQWTRAVGLPADPVAAARVAATGTPAPLGLIREDQGGIVLHSATLRPWTGRTLGVRAYVEDAELVNAPVRALTVTPDADDLAAAVSLPWPRRGRTLRGRAVTVSCAEALLTVDGADLPNPRRRATWWFEPARWRLVRP
jgi:hypothetical protein